MMQTMIQTIGKRPELIKRTNKAVIMTIVNEENSISRAELSRKTRLAIPTVMRIVEELKEEGFLVELGIAQSSGGRPPKMLGLNPKGKYAIAVKILPNELRVALANLKIEFLAKTKEKIKSSAGYERILIRLNEIIREMVEKAGVDFQDVLGIGIGVPGIVNYSTGKVVFAPNLKGWIDLSVGSDMEKELGVPVFIENEARISTLAEKWYGSGRKVKNFVCVDIAVGIGAGIVIDGNLYHGFENLAGEIGHSIVIENGHGPPCNCGRRGCLETVASNTAILKSIKRNPTPMIMELCQGNKESLTMKHIIRAVLAGDKRPQEYIQKAAKYLGRVIGQLINVINPEAVMINGDITLAGEVFFDPLKKEVKKYAFRTSNVPTKIIPSNLGENLGLIGAASIVIRKIFKA